MTQIQPYATSNMRGHPQPVVKKPEVGLQFHKVIQGDTWMSVLRALTKDLIHPNAESLYALARYNNFTIPDKLAKGNEAELPILNIWTNFKFPPVTDTIKSIIDNQGNQVKFQAYYAREHDTFESIALGHTGYSDNAGSIKQLNEKTVLKPGDILFLPIIEKGKRTDDLHPNKNNYLDLLSKHADKYQVASRDYDKIVRAYNNLPPSGEIKDNRLLFFPDRHKWEGLAPSPIRPAIYSYKPTNPHHKPALPKSKLSDLHSITSGLTTSHQYWKELVQAIPNFVKTHKIADIVAVFDLAHLIIKEAVTIPGQEKDKWLEMQLIALTVFNRMKTVQKNGHFTELWGKATSSSRVNNIQKIMLQDSQYSCFNDNKKPTVASMTSFYSPEKWMLAIKAAKKIYSGNLSGIDEDLRYVVGYYNPNISSPDWPEDTYGKREKFIKSTPRGCDHIYVSLSPDIPGSPTPYARYAAK